ncbi:MAG TPA: ABC transporter permease [Acidimicrobiales bacterium]|nr:ABC transporter permease [Acidimicrobiales bacterium]
MPEPVDPTAPGYQDDQATGGSSAGEGNHADAAIADALGGDFGSAPPPSQRMSFGSPAPEPGLYAATQGTAGAGTTTGLIDPSYADVAFEPEIMTIQQADLPDRAAPGSRRRRSQFRRLGPGFYIAATYCTLVILVAIFANLLPLQAPNADTCLTNGGPGANAGPSLAHWLGCDTNGRDVFSRVIFGSRVSLVVGFASIAMAELVGGTLAIVAGFYRGAADWVLSVIMNVILAFPYLILALAITTFWGHGWINVTVIIAIVATAPLFRVVRANTIAFTERDYVLAATALGSSRRRTLVKQILPDVVPTAITYGFVGVSIAVTGEGALSFLGQSVPIPQATWGNMIAAGSGLISSIGSPGVPVNIWLVLGPAIALFAFVVSINFIGDRLRQILDVREGVL